LCYNCFVVISLDSIVGELHLVGGQRQSETPQCSAFTAPRRSARGRQNDTLFILVDAGGSASLIQELIQRIQQTYWHTSGSVTAGLRAAIDAGNEWLVDNNRSALAAARAGVTCAVLRGPELFIAQTGPSCAYLAHQGRLERFPRSDAAGSLPPLGVARAVEVRFSRADLHPGDTLLLADASLPARIPEEAIASSIVYVGVETALDNLERLVRDGNLSAMLIEVTAAAAAPETSAAPAVAPATKTQRPDRVSAAPPRRSMPQVGEWAASVGQGVSRGLRSLSAAARGFMQTTLPDRPAARPARRRGASSLESHTLIMAAIAIGIPLIVAAVVTTVYVQRSAAAQVETLVAQGQASMAQADAAATGEEKRARWSDALAAANQALALDPNNEVAIVLRAQAQAQLDQQDGTQRLSPILLYDYTKAGRRRLTAQGASLFVMDPDEGRVDRFALSNQGDTVIGGEPAPAVSSGVTLDDRVIGALIDMAWIEAGGQRQKSALVILERGGLVEYDPAFGPSELPFAQDSAPPGVVRMDTFDGNIYLLDATGQQLWKYAATADGYTTLPEGYFETAPPGIANAIDLAIDGNVYLLESNGAAHKYFGGEEAAFQVSGLPSPIGRPVAAAVDPYTPTDSGFYVADREGARIIHLAPDGRFIRQLRAPGGEFDALEDILVDERLGRLYVISGGRLYSTALPPAAAP